MTTVDRNWLFLVLSLLALVLVSTSLAALPPFSSGVLMIPVVIAIELVVYFVAAMVANARATIGMAFGAAVVQTILRAVCAFAGGILYVWVARPEEMGAIHGTWVNPVPAIIQIAILLLAGPYLMAIILPDLVGRDTADRLLGATRKPTTAPITGKGSLDTSPTGGFIQVFSFEELAGVIKKSHGIEGFLVINNEGLVVWKDFPMRVNTDVLAARIYAYSHMMSNFVEGTGLTKVRRVMVESREHFLFSTTLDQNFNLLLIFNGRVAPEEIMSRVAVMAKTCREFLQWRYPSLPLKAEGVRELAMVESTLETYED